ncbi:hypothetical protein [Piscinibacter sp.]|jgi:TRAP-type C4-dicarboxylate transport system substrate-binding protein|uniref:hypothetical protein n=1 Tax=Piscinibacter sp. TaxID=1903157 RepID=UPI002F3FDBD2
MDANDLDRRQWLGVFGAGAVAAAITALAMPWPAEGQSPVVIKLNQMVAGTAEGKAAGKFKELSEKRLPGREGRGLGASNGPGPYRTE